MTRDATCVDCGAAFVTPSDTGRLPLRCRTCAGGSASYVARYRERVLDLERWVATLENERVELRAEVERILGVHVPGADREMLAAAVRAVTRAEGRAATRAALLRLRDVAYSWADALAVDEQTAERGEAA